MAARRRRRQLDLAAAGEPGEQEAAAPTVQAEAEAASEPAAVPVEEEGVKPEEGGGVKSAAGSEKTDASPVSAAGGVGGRRRRRKGPPSTASEESAAGVGGVEKDGGGGSKQGSVAGSAKGEPEAGGPKEGDGSESARSSQAPGKGGPLGEGDREGGAPAPEPEPAGDGKILEVTVHGTDELKPNIYLMHPVIQLSILDVEDGKCVKKRHVHRNVVYQHENTTEPDRDVGRLPKKDRPKSPTKKEKKSAKKGAKDTDKDNKATDSSGGETDEERAASARGGGDAGAPPSPMKSRHYDRVLPVQTKPYDLSAHLREGRPLECLWEEDIGYDEDASFFMNPNFIFVFELMDFIHTVEAGEEVDVKKHKKYRGWKRIAWGFLRPNDGQKKFIRMGEKVRLQLYKYRNFWFWNKPKAKNDDGGCLAFQQWKAGGWKPYKSTMFVTIRAIDRPFDRLVSGRALMPWEREEGNDPLAVRRDTKKQDKRGSVQEGLDKTRLGKKWIGATGKWCKVPNMPMHKLESDHRGCFVVSFSSSGTFLACAVGGRQLYRIKIFNVATGSLAMTLPGHHEIVYDMQWGMEVEDMEVDDALNETAAVNTTENNGGGGEADGEAAKGDAGPKLLTASADTTAKVWNVESAHPLAVCHHPTYVYSAKFCPGPDGVRGDTPAELAESATNYVLTGCYDHNLRLWDVSADGVSETHAAQILKLISGHASHINSIVVDKSHSRAYSADGIGGVRVWSIAKHTFDCTKEVNEPEVKGDAINSLLVDRSGKRLLVLARDNCIRMLDTESWKITQRFSGLRCSNHQIRCDLSPDGRYLMSGSEDGQVFVWNVDTGEQDTTVSRDRLPHFSGMCTDVAWNPAERIVAACSFSRKHPILLYKYERDSDALASEEITEEEVRDCLQGKFSELAEAFRKMDKSGDGKLQLQEFRDGILSMELGMSDVQILRMFKAAAGSNPDEIDRDEFIKKFAPAGTFSKIKTVEAIERERQRRADMPRQRNAAVLGLLDELDGTSRAAQYAAEKEKEREKEKEAREAADDGAHKKRTLTRKKT